MSKTIRSKGCGVRVRHPNRKSRGIKPYGSEGRYGPDCTCSKEWANAKQADSKRGRKAARQKHAETIRREREEYLLQQETDTSL